jgi:MtN3 and saliva related transmembrane protein
MNTLIFGWIGVVGTFLYKLPQIYKFYKLKNSDGVSLTSYIIQTIGYVCQIIHGFIINDLPTITLAVGALFLNLILCFQQYYYRKQISPDDEINNI